MTSSSPSILYVVNDPAFFLSHRLNIALAAQAQGFDVSVAAPADPGYETIERHGIKFFPVPLNRWSAHPMREIQSLFALIKLYRTLRPSIVHHITIKPVLYGSLAARLTRIPAVVNAISGMGQVFSDSSILGKLRRQIVLMLYRVAFNHANSRVIFQNPDDQNYFIGAGLISAPKTILTKGAGVNLQHFRPLPQEKAQISVLFPARLLVEKGIREFVEAARKISSRGRELHRQIRFIVAGTEVPGNPGSVLPSEVLEWKKEGTCEFIGYCEDMQSLLQSVQIVCLPSYYKEGIPKSLIEAAACGLPLVATDWPGCREIAKDHVNALLVPPRNASALAAAIERLVQDSRLREEMGNNSRRLVVEQGFSDQTVVGQTLTLYATLSNRKTALKSGLSS